MFTDLQPYKVDYFCIDRTIHVGRAVCPTISNLLTIDKSIVLRNNLLLNRKILECKVHDGSVEKYRMMMSP